MLHPSLGFVENVAALFHAPGSAEDPPAAGEHFYRASVQEQGQSSSMRQITLDLPIVLRTPNPPVPAFRAKSSTSREPVAQSKQRDS